MKRPILLALVVLAVIGFILWDASIPDERLMPVVRGSGPDRIEPLPDDLSPATEGPPAEQDSPVAEADDDPAEARDPKPAGFTVQGQVVDGEGKPVAEAVVWAARTGERPLRRRNVTGEDGRYTLTLTAGATTVKARAPGTLTTDAPFDVAEDGAKRVDGPTLVLRDGAFIEGSVVDERGKPRPYIRVQCWQETGETWETLVEGRRFMVGVADTVTNDKGEFRLTGLEPAQPHKVFVNLMMLPGHKSEPAELTGCLPGGEPLKFTVAGERMARGRVLDADSGLALVGFAVNGAGQWTSDGTFAVPAGGRVDIEVSAPGYVARTVPIGDAADLEVRLDPDPDAGVLAFDVVDSAGRAVPDGTLVVLWSDASFRMHRRMVEVHDGVARLERMPAGTAHLTVTMEGHGREVRDVVIQARSDTRVHLVLPRTGSVRLRIVDAKGNVIRHIPGVLLKNAEGNGPSCRFVYTNPQGTTFVMTETWSDGREGGTPLTMSECDGTLHELPPGKYTLHVGMRDAKKDVAFDVKAGETTPVTVTVGR